MLFPSVLALFVVASQVMGGAILWLWVRKDSRTPLVEALGMGVAVGTVLAVIGSQLTILVGIGGIGWILPVFAAALVVVAAPDKRSWLRAIQVSSFKHWVSAGLVSGLALLTVIPGIQRTPIQDGYVSGSNYHGDLVFFEAIAQFLSRTGANDSSLLVDFGIRYHWFAYGWIGSLTDVTGADPFVIMTRVFPVLMVVGASFLSVAWAARLSKRSWTPLLAGLLVVVAGFVGASQGVILNFDSPSTAYAAVLALAFGLALTNQLRSQSHAASQVWPSLLVLGLLGAGTLGAKASQAAVIALGLIFLGIAGPFLLKVPRRTVWSAVAATGLAMLATYVLVISGVAPSESNIAFSLVGEKVSTFQGLDPFPGTVGGFIGSLVLILAILPRWLGAPWLFGRGPRGMNGEAVFGAGVAVAGLLPILLLNSGTNAGWFAVAASPILAVLSAVGLERAWEQIPDQRVQLFVLSAIAAIGVNAVVFVAYGLGAVSGAPVLWRGPVLAWLVAMLLAIPIAVWVRSNRRFPLRWVVTVTTILVLASIGARFNGATLWSVSQDRLSPALQCFIRWTDPDAEFPGATAGDVAGSGLETPQPRSDAESAGELAGNANGILQWSPGLNEAAMWLEQQVADGGVVAVDATYLQPFLPVVTDLQMYVAGEPYISGYTTQEGAQAAADRQEWTQVFLSEPSQQSAQRLWADGVRWLWLRETPEDAIMELTPWAPVVYANDQVTILQLSDPGANSE